MFVTKLLQQMRMKFAVLLLAMVAVGVFAIVAGVGLLHPGSQLANLEPYPDSLLYALSAREFAQTGELGLRYQDSFTELWVPELYPLVLSVGYFLVDFPLAYVLVNAALLSATVLFIWLSGWSLGKRMGVDHLGWVAIAWFLLHGFVWWIATLAMTENLALLGMAMGLFGLLQVSRREWGSGVWAVVAGGVVLLMTRYATAPIAAALLFCAAATTAQAIRAGMQRKSSTNAAHSKNEHRTQKILPFIALAVSLGTFATLGLLYTTFIGDPIQQLSSVVASLTQQSTEYYSFSFIVLNGVQFTKGLLGLPTQFLWLQSSLSSIIPVGFAVLGWLLLWGRARWIAIQLALLSLATLSLPLIFYTADQRYIIYLLPLIALTAAYGFDHLISQLRRRWPTLKPTAIHLILPILLVLHLTTQLSVFKDLISTALGRTTGWQVQAIHQMDSVVSELTRNQVTNSALELQTAPLETTPQVYVITALPPFLVRAYQTEAYRTLPVSIHQEFAAKHLWVWGNDLRPSKDDAYREHITTEELTEIITQLAADPNTQVLITNAYLSHSYEVTQDYHLLIDHLATEGIELMPLSSGCENTCSIWLTTKE